MKTKQTMMVGSSVLVLTGVLMFLGITVRADEAKPQVKPYPLKTCVVSGEKLGEMGDPDVFTNNNREIKLCCKSCLKKFNKDEAGYVKKLEAAEAKARKP